MTHARISRIEILLKCAQTGKNSGVKAHIKRGQLGTSSAWPMDAPSPPPGPKPGAPPGGAKKLAQPVLVLYE